MPAAAQTIEEDYRAAVAARLSGDPAGALERLQRVVVADPDNADARLQLGLSLLALDRLPEAEAAFDETLALAPDYADARIGLARVAQRRGDVRLALRTLAPLRDHPEAAALRLQLEGAAEGQRRLWRIDAGVSYSFLEGDQPDWRELNVALRHQVSPRTSVALGLQAARRFGVGDIYGEALIEHAFSERASVYLLAGATPEADFRPEWQLGLGGSLRVRDGGAATVLRADARLARFPSGDIVTLTPGVEQYMLDGRVWLTAQWINIFGEDGGHDAGWLLRGDVLATPRLRLFAGVADAPDVTEGIVVETLSAFGGAAWQVGGRHELRVSLAHEDRASGSDRTTVSIGLGLRF